MLHLESGVARERGLAHLAQHGQIKQVVFAQFVGPLGKLAADFSQHLEAGVQFYNMALAVVKRDGFDPLVFGQGLRQTGGGILATREKYEGGCMHPPNVRG